MTETLLFGHVVPQRAPEELRRGFDVIPLFVGPTRKPGTFRSDVKHLRALAGSRWNARLFDLLTVMCTLRAADRFMRSRDIFDMSRDLNIACTVHEPERWLELAPLLARAVFRLSADRLHFTPVPLRHRIADAEPLVAEGPPFADENRSDCVCLFSGGADSFCGAAHLLMHRRRPLFVCLSVGGIAQRQRELFEAIRARLSRVPADALIQLTPWPNSWPRDRIRPRRGWQHRDSLQRLRAMFFFSLAALVGLPRGIDEIFMCENGIIGAAIAFSPSLANATTTRPAEPSFLRAMEELLQQTLDAPALRIRNPFQYMTKGEVLRECAKSGLGETLPHTVSCWQSGQLGISNCGTCVPCLFRQLAFDESGLPERGTYRLHAIPEGASWSRWKSSELPRLRSVAMYSRDALRRGVKGLMMDEPAVFDAIDVTAGPTHRRAVPGPEQEALDEAAPRKMARAILRFARASAERLPWAPP
jgi:7-cyano-7-deazaguanine synthase in queuosine biosynthesis